MVLARAGTDSPRRAGCGILVLQTLSLFPPKPSPLVPGYRLDRYELLCPIAQGGMASVWVARQRGKHGFEKLVAIKTILPQYATDPRFHQMFLDEAHIAAAIEHVNVAQILDLGEEAGVLYLAMEFVDGDALSKLQRACDKKKMKMPPGIVLRILADACAGLQAAHELRDRDGNELHVVHRDVSPQNIMVTQKGVAKLIDFGIAKARDRMAGDTGAGLLKGKVHYMPPEQAMGKHVDARADVWAIGAIAYHLLSGHLPFDGENHLATLHLLTSGRPPLPLMEAHPSVAFSVRRAMTFEVDKRIGSCAELQQELEEAMHEAELSTTSEQVGAFMDEHLGDRRDQRRRAIKAALQAAAERGKASGMRALMVDGTGSISASGVMPLPTFLDEPLPPVPSAVTVVGQSGPGVDPLARSGETALASAPGVPSSGGVVPSEVSNATLGSAAIEALPASPAPTRNRGTLAVSLFLGALILGSGAFLLLGKKSAPPTSAGPGTEEPKSAHASATTTGATSTMAAATASATIEPSATTAPEPSAGTSASAGTAPTSSFKFPPFKPGAPTKPSTSTAPTKKPDDGF